MALDWLLQRSLSLTELLSWSWRFFCYLLQSNGYVTVFRSTVFSRILAVVHCAALGNLCSCFLSQFSVDCIMGSNLCNLLWSNTPMHEKIIYCYVNHVLLHVSNVFYFCSYFVFCAFALDWWLEFAGTCFSHFLCVCVFLQCFGWSNNSCTWFVWNDLRKSECKRLRLEQCTVILFSLHVAINADRLWLLVLEVANVMKWSLHCKCIVALSLQQAIASVVLRSLNCSSIKLWDCNWCCLKDRDPVLCSCELCWEVLSNFYFLLLLFDAVDRKRFAFDCNLLLFIVRVAASAC